MASAALPAWLSDVPGDIAAFFEMLAYMHEDNRGQSRCGALCPIGQSEVVDVWGLRTPPWQNQRVVERCRLPSHVPLYHFENVEAALARTLYQSVRAPASNRVLALTPARWKFQMASCPSEAPAPQRNGENGSAATSVSGFPNSESWAEIDVPLSWELAGHGQAIYLNTLYPFPITPPHVPVFDNPVGCYERSFEVPSAWETCRVVLHLDGIGNACLVWVDGLPVGYSQDGRLPCEFDVTDALRCNACGAGGLAHPSASSATDIAN